MSQHLPGKKLFGRSLLSWLLLFCVVLSGLFASSALAEGENGVTGVVKPKVYTLAPRQVSDSPKLIEYGLPTKYSMPFALAVAKDNKIWITLMSAHTLALLDPVTNELKEYRIPSTEGIPTIGWKYDPKNRVIPDETFTNYSIGNPASVIVDKTGDVWFVMQLGNSVVRFNPEKEEFTEFIVPVKNAQPYDLVADSKGKIWFINKNAGSIGYLDPARQKMGALKLPRGTNMMGITVDKNDKIWVGDVTSNTIGRYDPETKKIRKFPINIPMAQPGQMKFGPNGILWFCALRSQQLGSMFTDRGIIAMTDLPGYNTVPQALAPAKDGKIWFVDSMTNKYGYFDSLKVRWEMFDIKRANAQPMDIVVDNNDDIWFTQSDRDANSIVKIVNSTVPE